MKALFPLSDLPGQEDSISDITNAEPATALGTPGCSHPVCAVHAKGTLHRGPCVNRPPFKGQKPGLGSPNEQAL